MYKYDKKRPMTQAAPPDFALVRSPRRRRSLALYVESDGTLRVVAPMKTSLRVIQDFVRARAAWIQKRRCALAKKEALTLRHGMTIPFQGMDLQLNLVPCEAPSTSFDENTLTLALPLAEGEVKTALTLWYKQQARRTIPPKLETWAERMKLKPRAVLITSPRSRWGSCSARDEIRLNWRLIMAAPELMDYLMIHELAHIKHKNHGKRFWGLVEKTFPQHKECRARLRKFEKSPFVKLFE